MSLDEITTDNSVWPLQPIGPVNLYSLAPVWARLFERETPQPTKVKAFVPKPSNEFLKLASANR